MIPLVLWLLWGAAWAGYLFILASVTYTMAEMICLWWELRDRLTPAQQAGSVAFFAALTLVAPLPTLLLVWGTP